MASPQERLSSALAGRYTIERELGAGGMATVYLAHDLKHDRYVALKLLKPELAAVLGAERFVVEIKTTAALQHPHILPLFDSGTAEGFLFYVMPYVEGETLRSKLDRETQLGMDEAVKIARDVADALDYAHRHGVIHRDIKPENILLHDGRPMVADFGIALAVSAAAGGRMTETGLSLGTPHYMSPEQATAEKEISARSDVYSLGSVLYEMLTGNPPHTGASAQQIIMRIITEPAEPVTKYRKSVPANVAAAVARALEKLPADRFETAKAFADALANPAFATTQAMGAAAGASVVRGGVSRGLFAGTAALVVVLLAVVVADRMRPAAPAFRARLPLTLGDSSRLRSDVLGVNLALSPDGSQLAWIGGESTPRLYLRALDDLAAHPLAGTDNASNPLFSPDGKWLAFVAGSRLKRMPLNGGPMQDVMNDVVQCSWGDGDVVLCARNAGVAGLWRVTADGGTPVQVTDARNDGRIIGHYWPYLLPGSKAALFAIRTETAANDSLAVVTLADGHVTKLGIQGTNPRYLAPGYLIYSRADGTVLAAPFEARSLRAGSPAVPLFENVDVIQGTMAGEGGATAVAFSSNGVAVYAQGGREGALVSVDRRGIRTVLVPAARSYGEPRYSPDGKRLAVTVYEASEHSDIWIRESAGTMTRLTSEGHADRPSWTSDGHRLAWRTRGDSTTFDMHWAPADGSGAAELLMRGAWSATFAPNGKHFFATFVRPKTSGDIDDVMLDSARTISPFAHTEAVEYEQKVSPDGDWVAFVSSQSGRSEVYVRAAVGPTGMHQISTDGGIEPVWGLGGRELFYRAGQKMMSAQLATKPEFSVFRRDTLFDDAFLYGNNYADYDVAHDGRSFVMVKSVTNEQFPIIMFGVLDELHERLRATARK